jgi:hypothetical protein
MYRVAQRCRAESKDPGGAYLTHAARTFSTTEARIGRTGYDLSLETGLKNCLASCHVRCSIYISAPPGSFDSARQRCATRCICEALRSG